MDDQEPADRPEGALQPDGRRRLPGLHRRKTEGSLRLMRYLPKSASERQEMLQAIGARSSEDLFVSIPAAYQLKRPLNLPGPLSEMEIIDYFRARATENSRGYASFLGAGVYNHVRSVVTDTILQRGEFLTSYTPYQPEISQGTLQAIFEFQTLMCQLTGQVLANYGHNVGLQVDEAAFTPSGQIDAAALRASVNQATAAVVVQSPNFFGVLEQLPELAEIAHARDALLVVAVTEGVSLGIVRPPAEADIVAMEGQSFGLAP